MMARKTAQTNFHIISGKVPVLLSAPHTFPHLRPNLDGVYKSKEPWLDVIIDSVAQNVKANAIRPLMQLEYDPNFHPLEENEYKAQVASIIKGRKIQYFIDLHGLHDRHEYDFGVFYPLRFSKSKRTAYDFASAMNSGALRGSLVQILNLYDNGQETLTEFVAKKMRIPAIQIEVGRYIREDAQLRGGLIDNIESFIITL